MLVPEIIEVKELLESLKAQKLLTAWELPYENILTRRGAAVFFLTLDEGAQREEIWRSLEKYDHFSYQLNDETRLSKLQYRVTFSERN